MCTRFWGTPPWVRPRVFPPLVDVGLGAAMGLRFPSCKAASLESGPWALVPKWQTWRRNQLHGVFFHKTKPILLEIGGGILADLGTLLGFLGRILGQFGGLSGTTLFFF